jgi:hypothetical protein
MEKLDPCDEMLSWPLGPPGSGAMQFVLSSFPFVFAISSHGFLRLGDKVSMYAYWSRPWLIRQRWQRHERCKVGTIKKPSDGGRTSQTSLRPSLWITDTSVRVYHFVLFGGNKKLTIDCDADRDDRSERPIPRPGLLVHPNDLRRIFCSALD